MALTEQRRAYLRRWREKNLDKERKRQAEWQRKWRRENPEEARRRNKIRHAKRKEQTREYMRHYKRKIDPVKLAARTILNNAVKLGKIQRPSKCGRCPETKNIQAHHHDYSLPLEVEWLCSSCHALTHYPICKQNQS